jgi:molybdopterin synthase catalytic subunit
MSTVPIPADSRDWVALFDASLPIDEAVDWATLPSAGAVVTFTGVVRDESEGRPGVVSLDYEAYEGQAERVMAEIVEDARTRWPDLARVALLHRTGNVRLREPSVAVVVSSPHRADAFDAARYCIDTLKVSAPIWKREHWAEGADWAEQAVPIEAM